jgi:hypothetical protein
MEDVRKSNPMVSHCTVIGEAQPCSATLSELNYDVVQNHCLYTVIEKGKAIYLLVVVSYSIKSNYITKF